MAFKNEYVPALEQETSDFMRNAQVILRLTHLSKDAWVVDRENNRVLACTGRGREIDDHDEEYWEFLDGDKRYSFTTKQLARAVIHFGPPKRISLKREILRFWKRAETVGLADDQTIQYIKEAFQVCGAYGMASRNEECEHTLLLDGAPV